MDGRILSRARERLARQKADNEALRAQREAEAKQRIPELRALDAEQHALLSRIVRAATEPGEDREARIAELEKESDALCARRTELLTAHGYPADWLDGVYGCRVCSDRGYRSDGTYCDCLLALYEQEQAAVLSEALQLEHETFADFDLSYYSGADRVRMEMTLEAAKTYAAKFGAVHENLLFQGGTGLGKTFLSGCIARTVAARGFGVVYETAQNAFAAFEEQKFSRDGETYAAASDKVRNILNCDLLILDDLGTELTTGFTQSALYNIVNTRLTEGRQTIISTNLSEAELERRYLPQTVSRLLGEYELLQFRGPDIRAIRKQRKNSL